MLQFCEDQAHPPPPAGTSGAAGTGSGRVNQALAGALYSLIKDYYIFVTQVGCFLIIYGHLIVFMVLITCKYPMVVQLKASQY